MCIAAVEIENCNQPVNIIYDCAQRLTSVSTLCCHGKVLGESCKAYRVKLSPLEQKILLNIQLGVIGMDIHT